MSVLDDILNGISPAMGPYKDAGVKELSQLRAQLATARDALRPPDMDNLNADELADVERFKNAMLVKLNTTTRVRCFEGMEDRGGKTWLERQTWVGSGTNFILWLKKEVTELERARTNDEIVGEAVDVANFAMMVFSQAALERSKEEADAKDN